MYLHKKGVIRLQLHSLREKNEKWYLRENAFIIKIKSQFSHLYLFFLYIFAYIWYFSNPEVMESNQMTLLSYCGACHVTDSTF